MNIIDFLSTSGSVLGAIAFLFQLGKVYRFFFSFKIIKKSNLKKHLKKFDFNALLIRLDFSTTELKLIELYRKAETETTFMGLEFPERIQTVQGIAYRLPTPKERTALIALQNKGLLTTETISSHSGSGDRQLDRDFALSESVITDEFIRLFK